LGSILEALRGSSHHGVPHVDLALEIAKRFNLGYYDSLILAAARLGGCSVVYSEDLNPGQDYGGVRVENPFDQRRF